MDLPPNSPIDLQQANHRKSVLSRVQRYKEYLKNVEFHVDVGKSSSSAVYEYFSMKMSKSEMKLSDVESLSLLNEERERVEPLLEYIDDGDLRRWSLPDVRASCIGIKDWRLRLNNITSPYLFTQLPQISHLHLISKGNSQIKTTQTAVSDLLRNIFSIKLAEVFMGNAWVLGLMVIPT